MKPHFVQPPGEKIIAASTKIANGLATCLDMIPVWRLGVALASGAASPGCPGSLDIAQGAAACLR
jgi:hypothetical protein